MTSLERLEPYLKNQTPIKPMKNFVSTVSYLRPATENKYVNPGATSSASVKESAGSMRFSGRPQRLQSAGTLQGSYAASRVAKKRALIGRLGANTGLPSGQANQTLLNVRSGNTRATNISSNERSSPVMNNITEKGLSTIQAEPKHKIDQSQITF